MNELTDTEKEADYQAGLSRQELVTRGTREALTALVAGRHPGTIHLVRLFAWAHLPPHLQRISRPCAGLALEMVGNLGDGPELTAGLRKLREAKDCFVTQALE